MISPVSRQMKKSSPQPLPVNSMHVPGIAVAVAMVFGLGTGEAADLLRWDITGSSGPTGSGEASVLAAGVSGSPLTGNGGTGNSTSPVNTWNRNFPIHPDAASAMAGTDTASKAYFEFTTSAAPGYTVSISGMTGLNLTRTTIGPTTAALFYSTDGGVTFTQTGTDFTIPTNSLINASAAPSFAQTMSTTPIVIHGGETVSWRIVGFGSTTANRIGIGKASTDDFTLTGTSVPDVAIHNLVWNGGGLSDWNTSPTNLNWGNIDNANAPIAFRSGDNASINIPASITVAAAGLTAGKVTIGNDSGTVTLNGGSVSGVSLVKTGKGTANLTGINDFPGGVSLTGGILRLASGSSAGIGAIAMDNNAVLKTGAEVFSLENPLSIGAGGGTLEAEGDLTFNAAITTVAPEVNASHVLTKTGTGIATLAGTGTTALGSQMTINTTGGGVELDIAAGGLIFTGSGQRNLGGTSTWDAPVSLNGGSLMLHGATIEGTGAITSTGNTSIRSRLNFKTATVSNPISISESIVLSLDSANGDNALVIRGPVTGPGSVTKTGNGTVRLESDCAYTGMTVIEAGTLRLGSTAGGGGSIAEGEVAITAGNFFLIRTADYTFPNLISGAGNVQVSAGAGRTRLTGSNTYTGTTTVTTGTVLVDGDSSSANGAVTVNTGAFLGGNGQLGGAVTLQTDGGLAARLRNWSGSGAGTDYDDLQVAELHLDATAPAMKLAIDTSGLANFTESNRTFPFLKTSGGITDFDPAKVTITASADFPGTGTWSLSKAGNNLQVVYSSAAISSGYDTWAAGPPWNLTGPDALPSADPDHDGISNALEFVIGGNPATVNDNQSLPSATLSGPNLIFTFRRSTQAAYLNPAAQYSTGLGTWVTAKDGSNGVSLAVTPGPGAGMETVTVSLPLSLGAGGRLFARLQVVTP